MVFKHEIIETTEDSIVFNATAANRAGNCFFISL
jgi:hypothetical protein